MGMHKVETLVMFTWLAVGLLQLLHNALFLEAQSPKNDVSKIKEAKTFLSNLIANSNPKIIFYYHELFGLMVKNWTLLVKFWILNMNVWWD